MEDIDERLTRVMRRVAEPRTPPVDDLVSEGIARGERMRRRRAWAITVGGLAAALVTAVALVAGPELMNQPDTVASSTDDVPTPRPEDSIDQHAIDQHATGEDAIVEVVLDLFPAGEVSDVRSGMDSDQRVWFQFVYDDGAGPSWIQGMVGDGDAEPVACPVMTNGGRCEVEALDDGIELMRMAGPYYPQADRESDRLHWKVVASRPDGLTVSLGAMNAPTEKDSDISRPEPPLTLDELAAIVTSDRWPRP